MKVELQADEKVASTVQEAASSKEVTALSLPKEQMTHPPKITGGIPAGYKIITDPLDVDDSTEVHELGLLGTL